ncbi:MAG: hypothetical protein LBC88_03445 [Spirochaetaceae bacterium]|jgi:colicin import membrane protein|nr:hypothetical protein [Spirochaetaceae bacterium]
MYIVAEGHSFSTPKRGIIGPGAEITEQDFASKEIFLKKISKGHIVVGKSKAALQRELEAARAGAGSKREEADEQAAKNADAIKQAKRKAAEDAVQAALGVLEAKRDADTAAKAAAKNASVADKAEADYRLEAAQADADKKARELSEARDALTAAEASLAGLAG